MPTRARRRTARFIRTGSALLLALLLVMPSLLGSDVLAGPRKAKGKPPVAKPPTISCCTAIEAAAYPFHTHFTGSRMFYKPGTPMKFSLSVSVGSNPQVKSVSFPPIFGNGASIAGTQTKTGVWSRAYTLRSSDTGSTTAREVEIRAVAENGKAKGTLLSVIPDSLPPTISISSPADGATGNITKVQVKMAVSDPQVGRTPSSGISEVELWASSAATGNNWVLVGKDSTAPYEMVYSRAEGSNLLSAIAYDNVGNSTMSKTVETCKNSCATGVSNDELRTAKDVAATPFYDFVDIYNALGSTNDPVCSIPDPENDGQFIDVDYTNSVWYRLTAGPAGKTFSISTEGSLEDVTDENSWELDTVLGVYSASNGMLMGCNDDDGDLYTSYFEIGVGPNQSVYVMIGVHSDTAEELTEDADLQVTIDEVIGD